MTEVPQVRHSVGMERSIKPANGMSTVAFILTNPGPLLNAQLPLMRTYEGVHRYVLKATKRLHLPRSDVHIG